jgi:hypothetical protein
MNLSECMEWRDRASAQWYDDDGLVVRNLQSTQGDRDSGTIMIVESDLEKIRRVSASSPCARATRLWLSKVQPIPETIAWLFA